MNKKGIGVGQVFTFLVVALTFSLIMIFGYKSISGVMLRGEEVEQVQFQKDLENSIKGIYTEYGSVRVEKFLLPGKYNQVCLIDVDYAGQEMEELEDKDTLAYNVWQEAQEAKAKYPEEFYAGYDNVDYNVFLRPAAAFKVYKISIANDAAGNERGFLCLEVTKGSFSLRLEGKGDHTEISEAPVG